MSKADMRKEMLAHRKNLDAAEIAVASEKAIKNIFSDDEFLKAGCVGLYVSVRNELDTREAIERSKRFGKLVCLPKVCKNEIKFFEFMGFDSLADGAFGIPEPADGEEIEPEVIVVPGLAFDMHRHRLGYGKGYYDKYLGSHDAHSIGVCYEWQVITALPKERHDWQMNKLIAGDWVLE